MLILNNNATLVCAHELGKVLNKPSQHWVTISKSEVLVSPDPVGRSIAGCPSVAPGITPCLNTLTQLSGKSDLIRIDGKCVCLNNSTGFTDGSPTGTILYKVRNSGQSFVSVNI